MARALGFQPIYSHEDLSAQLQRYAPAALSTQAHPRTSKYYEFVNTMDVIEGAKAMGWRPAAAGQRIAQSDPSEAMYGRHVIKFEHPDMKMDNGDKLQMVMVNSHNRMAKLRLDIGVYRLVCSNGMIIKVPGHDYLEIIERHRAIDVPQLISKVSETMNHINSFVPMIDQMKLKPMTKDQRFAFAIEALALRHGQEALDAPKAALIEFLDPIREADNGDDLWSVYNVAQEKLISGHYVFAAGKTG